MIYFVLFCSMLTISHLVWFTWFLQPLLSRGYCVSDPLSGGTLCHWAEEFDIWATHSPMQQTAQHTYWKNCTDGKWFVRSKSCQKKMPQPTDGAPPACSECVKLAEPKKVQRVVQRFSAKYNAARLLQKRLFGTPDEVSGVAYWDQEEHIWDKMRAILEEVGCFDQPILANLCPCYTWKHTPSLAKHCHASPSVKCGCTVHEGECGGCPRQSPPIDCSVCHSPCKSADDRSLDMNLAGSWCLHWL